MNQLDSSILKELHDKLHQDIDIGALSCYEILSHALKGKKPLHQELLLNNILYQIVSGRGTIQLKN